MSLFERWLTGEEKPPEWHQHPEQKRYKRGFWNGVQVGLSAGMLLMWIALAFTRWLW